MQETRIDTQQNVVCNRSNKQVIGDFLEMQDQRQLRLSFVRHNVILSYQQLAVLCIWHSKKETGGARTLGICTSRHGFPIMGTKI